MLTIFTNDEKEQALERFAFVTGISRPNWQERGSVPPFTFSLTGGPWIFNTHTVACIFAQCLSTDALSFGRGNPIPSNHPMSKPYPPIPLIPRSGATTPTAPSHSATPTSPHADLVAALSEATRCLDRYATPGSRGYHAARSARAALAAIGVSVPFPYEES